MWLLVRPLVLALSVLVVCTQGPGSISSQLQFKGLGISLWIADMKGVVRGTMAEHTLSL